MMGVDKYLYHLAPITYHPPPVSSTPRLPCRVCGKCASGSCDGLGRPVTRQNASGCPAKKHRYWREKICFLALSAARRTVERQISRASTGSETPATCRSIRMQTPAVPGYRATWTCQPASAMSLTHVCSSASPSVACSMPCPTPAALRLFVILMSIIGIRQSVKGEEHGIGSRRGTRLQGATSHRHGSSSA